MGSAVTFSLSLRMTPTMHLKIFVFALLYVHEALGESPACEEATKAVLEYRDFALKRFGPSMVRMAQNLLNVNVESDAELQTLVCAITDTEPKTISKIAESTPMFSNERQLSFAYSVAMTQLIQDIKSNKDVVEYYRPKVDLYDQTGFPNWPLKLNKKELSKYISEASSEQLEMFYYYSSYSYGEVQFDRQALVEDLSDATSLVDFAKRAYMFRNGDDMDEMSLLNNAESEAKKFVTSEESTRERAGYNEEHLRRTMKLYDTLARSGFLNVTRGGPELYSCDFIANKAVEALGYAEEIFGSITVRMFLRESGFSADVEHDLRLKVCTLLHATSMQEIYAMLPPQLMPYDGFMSNLPIFVLMGQYGLVQPGQYLLFGMSFLTLTERLDDVGYPDFPLAISTEQAKQLATLIKGIAYTNDDVETIAEKLQDEASLRELMLGEYEIIRYISGKTDTALKLAACVYQLLMSAEEQGLFMLQAQSKP